jgi:hypothetical protein
MGGKRLSANQPGNTMHQNARFAASSASKYKQVIAIGAYSVALSVI